MCYNTVAHIDTYTILDVINMARKIFPTNPQDFIDCYLLSYNVRDVMEHFGCSKSLVHKRFFEAGLTVNGVRDKYLGDIAFSLYQSGLSVKAICEKLNVVKERRVINKWLISRGVTPRNRSEAMFNRMKNTTSDERKRLAEKAQDTIRGKKLSESALRNHAISKQFSKRKQGVFELAYMNLLDGLSVEYIPEFAFGKYNIDFMIGNVAVEVYKMTGNPFSISKNIERTKYINNFGISVLAVWCGNISPTIDCAKYAIALNDVLNRNPSLRGKNWMIRSSSNLCFTEIEGNHFTII